VTHQIILDAAKGREFEIAVRYCGLSEGRRGKGHNQSCPFCEGRDRFWFYPEHGTFHCRMCGFAGNIITLLRAVNGISYWQALETLADEVGVFLHKCEKRTKRVPTRAIWGDFSKRLTLAMLVLNHLRFVPGTEGVDFEAADIEETERHARELVNCELYDIVRLLAVEKYAGDTRKAWVVLECLHSGADIPSVLRKHIVDWSIQEIRTQGMMERMKLEKEIELELERR